MSKPQTTSPQGLARGHSFINRTPHAVLMIAHKNCWQEVLAAICKGISCNNFRSTHPSKDTFASPKNNKNTIKCLKIQQCQFQSKLNNHNKEYAQYSISSTIHMMLFQNITKLVIVKCNLPAISFCVDQQNTRKSDIFLPNLEQFDGSSNNFIQIPQFLFSCPKINRIYLEKNQIQKIPNQLCKLQNLKLLNINGNPLTMIGNLFYNSVQNKDKTLDFEWKLIFTPKFHVESPQSIPSMHTTGSIMSEIDNLCEQNFVNLTNKLSGDYLDLRKLISQIIKMTDIKMVDEQIESLVFCQHIFYLSFIQYLVTRQKCLLLIQECFESKKYQSLRFLLQLYQKIGNEEIIRTKRVLSSRQNEVVFNFASPRTQQILFKKWSNSDKENMVGHKKIKMLVLKTSKQKQQPAQKAAKSTNISQKIKCDNMKMSLKSVSTQKMSNYFNFKLASPKCKWGNQVNDYQLAKGCNTPSGFISTRDTECQNVLQYQLIKRKQQKQWPKTFLQDDFTDDRLLLHKLVTYDIKLVQKMSKSMISSINTDQFIWLLNQLQFSSQNRSQADIQAVFSSMHFNLIVNNIIISENSLQNIFNSVIYKKAIKLIIIYSHIQFLDDYSFESCSILKTILNLDDFQVFHYVQKRYPKFMVALFRNVPNFSLMQTGENNTPEINNVNLVKSIRGQNFSGISWRFLINSKSKIYKYIYKQHKKYIRHQLQTNSLKNWHFPQYIVPQSMIIRNDVHDYEVLKDYQQFQASFHQKDFKLHVKQTNRENSYSIAKKIYMEVIDQAKSSVRNLGKTKQKHKQKQSEALNHTLFETQNVLINIQSLKKIKSQKPSPEKKIIKNKIIKKLEENGLSSNEKFKKTYDIVKRNSIKLVSNEKVRVCESINKQKKKEWYFCLQQLIFFNKTDKQLNYQQNSENIEENDIHRSKQKFWFDINQQKQGILFNFALSRIKQLHKQ